MMRMTESCLVVYVVYRTEKEVKDQIDVFKILNVYKNIDRYFYLGNYNISE